MTSYKQQHFLPLSTWYKYYRTIAHTHTGKAMLLALTPPTPRSVANAYYTGVLTTCCIISYTAFESGAVFSRALPPTTFICCGSLLFCWCHCCLRSQGTKVQPHVRSAVEDVLLRTTLLVSCTYVWCTTTTPEPSTAVLDVDILSVCVILRTSYFEDWYDISTRSRVRQYSTCVTTGYPKYEVYGYIVIAVPRIIFSSLYIIVVVLGISS